MALTEAVGQTRRANESCGGPTNLVRIMAQQVSKDPPSYVFMVTNLSNHSIHDIIIGEGNVYGYMRGSQWNKPTGMGAPEGWKGTWVDGERSYYLYQADIPDRMISPGKSVCEFRINLPKDTRKVPTFFGDGKPDVQQTFKDLPFKVVLADASCLWGTIKTVDFIDK